LLKRHLQKLLLRLLRRTSLQKNLPMNQVMSLRPPMNLLMNQVMSLLPPMNLRMSLLPQTNQVMSLPLPMNLLLPTSQHQQMSLLQPTNLPPQRKKQLLRPTNLLLLRRLLLQMKLLQLPSRLQLKQLRQSLLQTVPPLWMLR
jgi:hypothetical protein